MNISDTIKDALEKKGLRSLKDASEVLGISSELLRVILNKGHLPKDKTLGIIAKKLGISAPLLILSAHQEKVPAEVKGFFLAPSSSSNAVNGQRKFPLSHEQCEYLERILTPMEIQLIRKLRQVSDETKTQVFGYVDFMFATKRVYNNKGNGS
ncbi:MAG: helix-turn-helix transcriptional regulator [Nitrospirota bacterium]